MPIKLPSEKIRILYVLADMQGCGWYRCMMPAYYILQTGEFHTVCAHELMIADLYNYDIVVFQRHFEDKVKNLWDAARDAGVVIIYETDDDFFNIRPANPANKFIHQKEKNNVRNFLKKADAVVVTTDFLAKRIAQENRRSDNIYVIPNMIEIDDTYLKQRAWDYDNELRIYYSGGPSHKEDFAEMQGAFSKLLDKYGNKIKFIFMGWCPDELKQDSRIAQVPWVPVHDGIKIMSGSHSHIGIVPLHDNIFNRSKSNIKWLEYTASGMVTVASDIVPYQECITSGKDGVLVSGNSVNAWVNALSDLIDNRDKIKPMWEAALKTLREKKLSMRENYEERIVTVMKTIYEKEMNRKNKKNRNAQ